MNFNFIFDRVYLRTMIPRPNTNLDFEDLIKMVAHFAPCGIDGRPLYENGKVCPKRVKTLIIKKTDSFISDFRQVFSDEDLATYTSYRQINKLIQLFRNNQKGCISCYSVVILYIMCRICIDAGATGNDIAPFLPFVDYFSIIIGEYYRDYPQHIVARFLYECLLTIQDGIEQEKTVFDFPPIPRIKPQP